MCACVCIHQKQSEVTFEGSRILNITCRPHNTKRTHENDHQNIKTSKRSKSRVRQVVAKFKCAVRVRVRTSLCLRRAEHGREGVQ